MINSYVAVDLETTGLDPKTDKIIEIGAVKVKDGMVTAEFSTLVNPRRLLETRITELTGIKDEMLRDAPDIQAVMKNMVDFCQGLPVLGHHIMFDYSFLKKAAVNEGLSFEKAGIDTLTLCRKFMPEEEKKNLAAACKYYGVEMKEAHRALSDAYAAHELYQVMLNRYGTGHEAEHGERLGAGSKAGHETSYKAGHDTSRKTGHETSRMAGHDTSRKTGHEMESVTATGDISGADRKGRAVFDAKTLVYKVKKEQPATKRQKEGLRELIKYHKIDITVQIDYLSRSEVSRMTDKIISQYGRITAKR